METATRLSSRTRDETLSGLDHDVQRLPSPLIHAVGVSGESAKSKTQRVDTSSGREREIVFPAVYTDRVGTWSRESGDASISSDTSTMRLLYKPPRYHALTPRYEPCGGPPDNRDRRRNVIMKAHLLKTGLMTRRTDCEAADSTHFAAGMTRPGRLNG